MVMDIWIPVRKWTGDLQKLTGHVIHLVFLSCAALCYHCLEAKINSFKRTIARSRYLRVCNVLLTIFHGNIKNFGDINMFN